MHLKTKSYIIFLSLLIAGVLVAGCTNNTGASNTTPASTVSSTPPAVAGPLFSAGDIVKNPKTSSVATAWLVLGYDSATDKYQRALIYLNSDGSWGYRENSNTEQADRTIMEKVYTEKVDHVDPSSVPTSPPTTVTTPGVVSTTARTVTTSTTTVTTTAVTGKPSIKDVLPDSGTAGTPVTITDLTGQNFASNATVKLSKSGNSDIVATNVVVTGGTDISCILAIPVTATPGTWDVVVTNPDGQFGRYTNYFSIHYDPNVAATSSGSSGGSGMISSVDPSFAVSGGLATFKRVTLTGTNLQTTGIKVVLRKSSQNDIIGTDPYLPSPNQMQVSFNIPSSSIGQWDVVILGSDGTTVLGTLSNGFEIR